MKINELINKIFKTKKAKTIALVTTILIILMICIFPFIHNDEASVDTDMLINTLQKSSELTTAKLTYTGMTEFNDEGIAFINRADFIMVYKATARIGIDVKDVKVSADNANKIIYVSIPKAEVQDVKVDSKSIKYFDEDFALFNVDEKEDGNKAVALAEEAAQKEINQMGGLKMADDQAELLIKGILANAIPDGYKIEVKE